MTRIAQGMSDDEARAASQYFAAIPASVWAQVIEADTVPKSYVGTGAMRFPDPGGGKEPLGGRIIALPQDAELAERRDPHSGSPGGPVATEPKVRFTASPLIAQAVAEAFGPAQTSSRRFSGARASYRSSTRGEALCKVRPFLDLDPSDNGERRLSRPEHDRLAI